MKYRGTILLLVAFSAFTFSACLDGGDSGGFFGKTYGTAAAPTFSPAPGTYTTTQSVTISTTTSGAKIRYTTDGSAPSSINGTLYVSPIQLGLNTTTSIKAIAYNAGWTDSPVSSATYTITGTVATPSFAPAPGTYTTEQSVAISTTTQGATIRYTMDGSTPSDNVGTIYSGPIFVDRTMTINAVAYKTLWATSSVSTGSYTMNVVAPTFSPAPGTYTTEQSVAISTTTQGATIRYTTDGSTPSDNVGTVYSSPFFVAKTMTINTVAYKSGWATSSVSTGSYTVLPWDNTGEMVEKRYTHTATLLPNGKVLIAGGSTGINENPFYSSAELYDPATGIWSATGSMNTARQAHTATLLPNGTVLVAGGAINITPTGSLSSAELYDPATRIWSATGSMGTARSWHTATLLSNGKVLVTGGTGNSGTLSSAELYDPATGLWSATGSMEIARHFPSATLLTSGKVLIAGGGVVVNGSITLSSAELYDPASELWTPTGSMGTARQGATLTVLPSGKVLLAGGWGGSLSPRSTELYDPTTELWTATDNMAIGRYRTTATLLPNGKVLVAGGETGIGIVYLNSAELYDPIKEIWYGTEPMTTARATHTATLLPNGKVLVAGGIRGSVNLVTAELYNSPLPPVPPLNSMNGAVGISNNTAKSAQIFAPASSGGVSGGGGGGCAIVSQGRMDNKISKAFNVLVLSIPMIILLFRRRR